MLSHYIHKNQGSADIVVIILPRFYNTLPDSLQACKVDDGVEGVLAEYSLQAFPVPDIAFIERNLSSNYFFHSFYGNGT